MVDSTFVIEERPNENWHIESPNHYEKYPKLIFSTGIKINWNWFILDYDAKIVFERFDETKETLEIPCAPYKRLIDRESDKEISFYVPLTTQLYNDIETFRQGENLRVHLLINRLFLISSLIIGKSHRAEKGSSTISSFRRETEVGYITLKHDVSPLRDNDHRLIIMRDEWIKRVIKPYNGNDRFIVEIPCKLPEIPALKPRNKDLKALGKRIEQSIDLLKNAIEEYNSKRDHEKCITKVREASDLLHTLGHGRTKQADLDRTQFYGKQLIENTGTGDNPISQEIIESIFKIIDGTFEISSKVPHGVSKSKMPFNYTPDHEDAEMLLGIISLVYYWISVKFEKSMMVK
ncbi:MAG: hypothetical protein MUO26_09840 [Methanotrichaceae archaeon]|nr:hypothetical protein [Methanotrichaceae archaeon]